MSCFAAGIPAAFSLRTTTTETLRIIGIDPGSRKCGYGIVERRGSETLHIDNGVMAPDPSLPLVLRILYIAKILRELIALHRPTAAAVEEVYFARNAKSALVLGQARGAAMLVLAESGLPIAEYAATRVKQTVVGYGKAEKTQVQHMVKLLLGLPEVPEENAADALAVAICRCREFDMAGLVAGGRKMPR